MYKQIAGGVLGSVFFLHYCALLLGFEGSLKDWEAQPANRFDRGGRTNFGITYGTYFAMCQGALGEMPTDSGFKHMKPSQAREFVRKHYDMVCGDSFPAPIAILLTDMAWGSGLGICHYRFRKVLRDHGIAVSKYGPWDSDVYEGARKVKPPDLVRWICAERRAAVARDIAANPTQAVFRNGWLNRINQLESYCLSLTTDNI